MRSGGRVVEGARLESEYTPKAYRGFESLPLRHLAPLPTAGGQPPGQRDQRVEEAERPGEGHRHAVGRVDQLAAQLGELELQARQKAELHQVDGRGTEAGVVQLGGDGAAGELAQGDRE